jgi:hypothetical protein
MNILGRAINRFLKVIAKGRIAQKGKLFRLGPVLPPFFLYLRPIPGDEGDSSRCYQYKIQANDKATFLVLKVQEDVPLWEQWIKVLFCRLKGPQQDDTMIGWLPYHEFNRLVLAHWETWEEERTL